MLNLVYHSSQKQNLRIIKPSMSTHKRDWVYATIDPVMAALFISGTGGDFTCQIGRDFRTGLPYVCERFPGAFEHRYKGKAGSIYILPGATFRKNSTTWEEEVVSSKAVIPAGEVKIMDVEYYIQQLQRSGELLIKYYPDRIDGIPEDDSDLVAKAAVWSQQLGEKVLDQVKRYHPQLLKRVQKKIENNDLEKE